MKTSYQNEEAPETTTNGPKIGKKFQHTLEVPAKKKSRQESQLSIVRERNEAREETAAKRNPELLRNRTCHLLNRILK